ncbi:MAG: Rne/Rng family ribonuclease [bacterium]|nr:Rne/Rng family ribonuclease [bacterium]
MKKEIIINSSSSETRIALLEDEILVELFVERPENERTVGDIYMGKVRKVLEGMRAAFVDIGWSQDAFLHFSDIGSGALSLDNLSGQLSEEDIEVDDRGRAERAKLSVGENILVQIIKEPIGTKGPRITSQLALPGRFCVLMPGEKAVGVSRRVADFRERRRLKQIAAEMRPEGCGLIMRTVAENREDDAIRQDVMQLHNFWRQIENKSHTVPVPSLIYKDVSLASSIIRDLFTSDIDHLVVDTKPLYREIEDYLKNVAPNLLDRLTLYTGQAPVFDYYRIETEIEKSVSRKVWLKGGGYIIIDHTEALVTIDVNSGRFVGKKNHEENSSQVNVAAAREVCRQLRLRDIGGIIVVDFIDMWEDRNRKRVEDEMRRELKKDRAKTDVAPISQFGLLEMTRQRIKPSLLYTFNSPCPTCSGTGLVASRETVMTALERWVKRFRLATRERRLRITVHPDIYGYCTGGLKSRINQLMWRHRLLITMVADSSFKVDNFTVWSFRQKRDITTDYSQGG